MATTQLYNTYHSVLSKHSEGEGLFDSPLAWKPVDIHRDFIKSHKTPLSRPDDWIFRIVYLSQATNKVNFCASQAFNGSSGASNLFSGDFSMVKGFPLAMGEARTKCVAYLENGHKAAADVAVLYTAFLALLPLFDTINSPADCKAVAARFTEFANLKNPVENYDLDRVDKVKSVLTSVVGLVSEEAKYISDVLDLANELDFKLVVEKLKEETVSVKGGCNQIKTALEQYSRREL